MLPSCALYSFCGTASRYVTFHDIPVMQSVEILYLVFVCFVSCFERWVELEPKGRPHNTTAVIQEYNQLF